MSNKELSKLILESMYTYGPLAKPEVLYLFKNCFEWIFKLDFHNFSNINNENISKNLKILIKKKKLENTYVIRDIEEDMEYLNLIFQSVLI